MSYDQYELLVILESIVMTRLEDNHRGYVPLIMLRIVELTIKGEVH